MSIWSVIADNSTAIYSVCIPVFVISAGYAAWKIAGPGAPLNPGGAKPTTPTRTTPRRPLSPVPAAKPKSLEQGQVEHQVRGEAKTVKVPVAGGPRDERSVDTARLPVSGGEDEAAKDELFSGLGQPAKKQETTTLRKAERLEELGFHSHLKPGQDDLAAAQQGEISSTAATQTVPVVSIPVVPKPEDPKRAETRAVNELAAGAKPRTQTQELDDILSRIDKVLAENPVMATTTLGSATNSDTTTIHKPVPPAAKQPDAKPDPEQQKLF